LDLQAEANRELEAELHQLKQNPLHMEVDRLAKEIGTLKENLEKWRGQFLANSSTIATTLSRVIRAAEIDLLNLTKTLEVKRTALFEAIHNQDLLQVQLNEAHRTVEQLTVDNRLLTERHENLVQEHEQLTQELQRVRAENLEMVHQTSVSRGLGLTCPVCLEPCTTSTKIVALLCGHVVCQPCREHLIAARPDEFTRNYDTCPTCRTGDLNAFVELFV
jgi:DNA repair exonuclease SbcCD ATPase subunit